MKPEKLADLKKELSQRSVPELTELCLRMVKYKKENKELLNYLLYDASDPMAYAEKVKIFLEDDFKNLQKHYYYSTKSLRKILRLLNKYAKYTLSSEVELELLLWFCRNFLEYTDPKTSHKPLQSLLIRQLLKIKSLIPKLHEDLQFDYQQELEQLLQKAADKLRWWHQYPSALT